MRSVLVGRRSARSELTRCLADAAVGQGGLVLLAGEAGVGKTHLATTAIVESQLFPLRATASHTTATPFAPLVSALRAFLRAIPDGLPHDGPVGRYLPVLLPERGSMENVDRVTLFETLVGAFLAMSRHQPTVVFLDDFHEADQATLELIPHLIAAARDLPLLLLGAYRADELRRDHPLRRLRAELRRTGPLRELMVEPLAADETADMAAHLLRGPVACQLARLLFERSDGLPLFVEELLTTLTATGRLQQVDGVWQLADPAALLPVPDSIRDLVLARAARLGCRARAALEFAAVAGVRFELDVVAPLCDAEDALDEAFALGLLVKLDAHEAAFRHALIRDAFYGDIARSRRRALHSQLAERLERRGTAPAVVANHWFAAREPERARRALLLATDAACRMHAYRDAAVHAQRAIDVWPRGRDEQERAEALDRLGRCAQLIGNLDAAAAAWREVADLHNHAGRSPEAAQALRRLASVYELQHAWELARAAREAAAEAFAASGAPAEAAAQRLAAADHLCSAASFTPALRLLLRASDEARQSGRIDLQARVLGLEGEIRARKGRDQRGVEQVRAALGLARQHDHGGAAAEVYARLGDAVAHVGDYRLARQTYLEAADFGQTGGAESAAQRSRAYLTIVLQQTGDWDGCARTATEALASTTTPPPARTVALGMLGLVRAQRGDTARARSALAEANHQAVTIELVSMELLTGWGLAMVDTLEGDSGAATRRCRELLDRWGRTEERHHVIAILRWAVTLFAIRRDERDARTCASALAQIVAETGATEAVAALGHALGELCLLDGNAGQAAHHFAEALQRHDRLELPYERAQTSLRAGLVLVAAGPRELGLQRLIESYRGARALGARPLANAAAHELTCLGEPPERRIGRRARSRVD